MPKHISGDYVCFFHNEGGSETECPMLMYSQPDESAVSTMQSEVQRDKLKMFRINSMIDTDTDTDCKLYWCASESGALTTAMHTDPEFDGEFVFLITHTQIQIRMVCELSQYLVRCGCDHQDLAFKEYCWTCMKSYLRRELQI